MQNKASKEIYRYWAELKGNRSAPLKSEIDPAALRRLLPYLFILTPGARGRLEFRLAGTRICELFGRELRTEPFNRVWSNVDAEAEEITRTVLREEQPALLEITGQSVGADVALETLLLPLRSGDAMSDRVLGSLLPSGALSSPVPRLSRLTLQNWSFLGAEPEAVDLQQDRGPAGALQQFLSTSLFQMREC